MYHITYTCYVYIHYVITFAFYMCLSQPASGVYWTMTCTPIYVHTFVHHILLLACICWRCIHASNRKYSYICIHFFITFCFWRVFADMFKSLGVLGFGVLGSTLGVWRLAVLVRRLVLRFLLLQGLAFGVCVCVCGLGVALGRSKFSVSAWLLVLRVLRRWCWAWCFVYRILGWFRVPGIGLLGTHIWSMYRCVLTSYNSHIMNAQRQRTRIVYTYLWLI